MAISRPTLAAIRFGYGLRPGEESPRDAEALLAQLDQAAKRKPRFPREGAGGRRETASRVMSLRAAEAKAAKDGKPNESIRKETQKEALQIYRQDAMARLAQAILSPFGFHERLASFWTDHFSTSALKSLPMRMVVPLYEAEAIRPNLAGSFANLLKAAMLHPAMLIYLDQSDGAGMDASAGRPGGRAVNESLGRELLELHTLGAGSGYTQEDVRAAALILTGLSVDRRALEVVYRPRISEGGSISLLGEVYEDDEAGSQDHLRMLEDLALNPMTAEHVCRKLVIHFVADEPPADVVAAMTAAWAETEGDLKAVYRAMLDHPRAWSDPGQKIKRPFEFVVSGFRAVDISDKDLSRLLDEMDDDEQEDDGPMRKALKMASSTAARADAKQRAARANDLTLAALQRMDQPIWQPPSPAGYADLASVWLSPGQLSERIAWARLMAGRFGQRRDPGTFLDAALGDAAGQNTRDVIAQAPNTNHAIAMVLASPEFNRR
ncbi:MULTISPECIES: DUF1800 domain-containing protein [unclassified Rhizobium]|uniref:DUF1800 domain-containing protein n=1 Tax=unclassified Rhizobium TaxID=2613769 RepID=UPI001AE51EAC|nr:MULTISPECIES: DUF1800 domain-containing protein [unclassified Rhizobium]MBP2461350.1 uncharacterized protein (DUF1800 family) [Rhizobium sp. PvP014]MBP2528746.1 uncharacterized protein (DUF1800 family) [Rhizobium sp. PvP099]